jgi:hypothetical protein
VAENLARKKGLHAIEKIKKPSSKANDWYSTVFSMSTPIMAVKTKPMRKQTPAGVNRRPAQYHNPEERR